MRNSARNSRLNSDLTAYVDGDGQRTTTGSFYFLRSRVNGPWNPGVLRLRFRGNYNVGAICSGAQGNRKPNAARGSRDEHGQTTQ